MSDGTTKLLVIGYGNTLRGDDGVGPLVAEAVEELRLPQCATLPCHLLTPELADPVSKVETVVFVDASVESDATVGLRELTPAKSSQVLGHAASPELLLALARDLYGHLPKAWLLTIPAESFEAGEHLSTIAAQGVKEAVELIRKLAAGEPSQTKM